MYAPFIPRADAKAALWFRNFADRLAQSPYAYGLGPGDAATVVQAVDAFIDALAVATSPATGTVPAKLAKQQARVDAERVCRLFAMLIKHNAGVSDPTKIALGVRPENRGRTRVPAPSQSPSLAVMYGTSGTHTLTWGDPVTRRPSRKPHGTRALLVHVVIGDAPATSPAGAAFVTSQTRTPFKISVDPDLRGKTATYFSRWMNAKGEEGPWGLPVSFTVMG